MNEEREMSGGPDLDGPASSLETPRLETAARVLREQGVADAEICIVLGSGLRAFGDGLADRHEVPFAAIPAWPQPKVEGHGASFVCGTLGGRRVVCLTGRVHLYEGYRPAEVVRAVRTLRLFGVSDFVLTNAAGGIADGMAAGDLMLIEDHLNLTGQSPLVGPAEPALGPRFPDQTEVWSAELRERLCAADPALKRGVYAGLCGPSYETPAEVRMLRTLGASAVGMSTVHEAMALGAMGARVAGVSLISNLAAGLGAGPLAHDEVIAAGRLAERRTTELLTAFCAEA